jgi:hypothetical protein
MPEAPPDQPRDEELAGALRTYFIVNYLVVEVIALAGLTALLALVPPPHTPRLYALIATITPLLLIALVVETHGAPLNFNFPPSPTSAVTSMTSVSRSRSSSGGRAATRSWRGRWSGWRNS